MNPLRVIRVLVDEVLAGLSGDLSALYSVMGRPSIPPEMLLRATLLQALYSVRSERMLMEQINYNLLFLWFVGLSMDAAVWHPTGFTHNRDRLLQPEVARSFLQGLLTLPRVKRLLLSEHFSVDGTVYKTGKRRSSAIDGRTPRHPGYEISLRCRKRIEEPFGWAKASAGLTKFKV